MTEPQTLHSEAVQRVLRRFNVMPGLTRHLLLRLSKALAFFNAGVFCCVNFLYDLKAVRKVPISVMDVKFAPKGPLRVCKNFLPLLLGV